MKAAIEMLFALGVVCLFAAAPTMAARDLLGAPGRTWHHGLTSDLPSSYHALPYSLDGIKHNFCLRTVMRHSSALDCDDGVEYLMIT